ncbi:MAG TPA: hypothetical protein VKR99_09150 [Candidatus Eremiobacteraceae bacterium]|nr:hypothetical protein [Candidatus Eremiobacteraceae bacterium]
MPFFKKKLAEQPPENPYGEPNAGGEAPSNDIVSQWPMQKIIEDNDRRMERSLDAPATDTETSHERPPD